jgi:alpha-N-acetylglucosaminidase
MHRRSFLTGSLSAMLPNVLRNELHHSLSAWGAVPALADTTLSPKRWAKVSGITILYNSRDSAEAAAALELQSYLSRLSGATPELVDGVAHAQVNSATTQFLVGRTPLVRELLAAGEIEDPAMKHSEAYLVRSVMAGQTSRVAFLGATGIATLYAVYHYLQKECGVGFYWDGDHIPSIDAVPVEGVSISTQPYFNERMCMNLTLYWYSVPWWDWNDWKAYIDWTLKARLNILSLWCTPGEDVAWERAWRRFGVKVDDASYSGPPYGIFAPIKYGIRGPSSREWRNGQSELTKKIIEYARARGMRTLAPAVSGIVPPEFVSSNPNARIFESSWSSLPKQKYLHPMSAQYHDVGKAFLEEYVSLYGTDHLYWLENYLECDVEGPPAFQQDVRREIAGANFRIVNEIDPGGVGILSAWTYLNNPHVWTPQLVNDQLKRLPADRIRVLDQWCDAKPEYKRMNYFNGLPWYFGIIHSFGGTTTLHGNMALLEKRVHEITEDPRAKRCVGFSPTEEVFHHNYFYFEFIARLGWNPKEVDLQAYTRHFARERYGESAMPVMTCVLEQLLASVYSSDDVTLPGYWHRLGSDTSFTRLESANRIKFIPHLRKALEYAMQMKEKLSDNSLYLHDLNDIGRQYLAELFNAHVVSLKTAHAALDKEMFERESKLLEQIMDYITEILSHDDYYWLSPFLRKARHVPGAPSDVDQRVRDILTLWAGVIRNYASRDYYELVDGYYHPRVTAYIGSLRDALNMDQLMISDQAALEDEYDAIENKWVTEGFPLVERKPDPKSVIKTVERILTIFENAEQL